MRKFEIACLLGKRYGYNSYLEICTPTTGRTFSKIDKRQFPRRVRLVYKNNLMSMDGEQTDLSTESENGDHLFSKLMRSGEKFDVVFIDSYHTYAASLRDLVYGLQLVNENGILLVHDCFPPDESYTSPEFVPGEWCGLTFAAYLDIVLFKSGIHYVTIDSDFGCGIIGSHNLLSQFSIPPADPKLLVEWRMLPLRQRYAFFESYHRELLHLISADEFVKLLSRGSREAGLAKPDIFAPDFHVNSQILANITIEDVENTGAYSNSDPMEIQEALATAQKNLHDAQRLLYDIQSTLTWRLHNYITNSRIGRSFYAHIIAPIKRHSSSTQ